QDPYGDELHVLGNAIGLAADDPSDMCSVARAVLCHAVVVDEVPAVAGPAAEVDVRDPDTAVHHVRGDVGGGVVAIPLVPDRAAPGTPDGRGWPRIGLRFRDC